jgi:hypothetical protein
VILAVAVGFFGLITAGTVVMAGDALFGGIASSGQIEALLAITQAVLTFGLVALTAFYAMGTRDMVEEMRLQRQWTEAREREAQARLVRPVLRAIHNGAGEEAYVEATVHNGSMQPIYDIALRLLDWSWRSKREVVINSCRYGSISPGSEGELMDNLGPLGPVPKGSESAVPPLEVDFRDADGRRWRREPDGRLAPLTEDAPPRMSATVVPSLVDRDEA